MGIEKSLGVNKDKRLLNIMREMAPRARLELATQ